MNIKRKSLILFCCLSLATSVFASHRHVHPQGNVTDSHESKQMTNRVQWPGACEIEIINDSYEDVRVRGVFDDGTRLYPFYVYSFEEPHYISLFYHGYCHAGMDLYIEKLNGYPIYSGYTQRQQTIRLFSYASNKIKAAVVTK